MRGAVPFAMVPEPRGIAFETGRKAAESGQMRGPSLPPPGAGAGGTGSRAIRKALKAFRNRLQLPGTKDNLMQGVGGRHRSGSRMNIAYRLWMPAVLVILALLALLAFGFLGIGRGGGNFAFDLPYVHVAGKMWAGLLNPYDAAEFKLHMKAVTGAESEIYAYPPNSAPLALLLSIGSLTLAKAMMAALGTASIFFLICFVYYGATRGSGRGSGPVDADMRSLSPEILLVTAAVIIGNPFTAHIMWMGQTTLLCSAFLLASWIMADRNRDIAAGILLGISAFKPQLAFLVGIWFLLDRRWSLVLAAAVTTIAVSALPVLASGIEGSWLSWLRSLRDYQDSGFNTVTSEHVFGLRSLLAATGITAPPLIPLGIIGLVLLYRARRAYENIWLVTAILAITFLTLFSHDYDVAPVAVMAYPLLKAARGRKALLGALLVLALILFFPQRIWERAGLGELARSREIALLAIFAIYLSICRVSQLTISGAGAKERA